MPAPLNPRSFHYTILIASLATTLSAAFGAVPNPPPSQWKGINYSPRYHSYFRMLNDWNNYDSNLGGYVRDIVDNDLALLSQPQNGYNLVHLYLWDHQLLDDAVFNRWCLDSNGNPIPGCTPPYSEPSGFTNYPGNPALFSSQFAALQDFVARAENHGLFVALHFASGKLIHDVQNSSRACSDIANDFGTWANTFVTGLTPARHNVLVWGVAFALWRRFHRSGKSPVPVQRLLRPRLSSGR